MMAEAIAGGKGIPCAGCARSRSGPWPGKTIPRYKAACFEPM